MIATLVAALALVACSPAASLATWSATGSAVRERCTHVGVRPVSLGAVDDDSGDAYGVSVRVSTDWPRCPR